MKLTLKLTIVCSILAGFYGILQWQHRNAVPHLRIFPPTRTIFEQADRVETFRLADFHENIMRMEATGEMEPKTKGEMRQYTVLNVGKEQNAVFAQELLIALEHAPPSNHFMPSCFDPGVGFRVHRGKEFVEIFVCFHCSGVEIITTNADKKEIGFMHTQLKAARKPLLLLSRRAFPDDQILQGIPENDKPEPPPAPH